MKNKDEKVEQLARQVKQLRATLDNVGAYVFTKDTNGRYTYANKMVRELFGATLEEVVGSDDSEFFDMSRSQDLKDNDKRVLQNGETIEKEEKNYIVNTGELRVYKSVKMPLRDDNDNMIGILGVSTDITELHNAKEELRLQSRTDYLTELNNRRYFLELANHEFKRSVRYEDSLSVIIIDIDNFKNINDSHGHHVGDEILYKLGSTCSEQVRDSDILARIGGEEFAILLPNTGIENAVSMAERIRKKVASIEHTGNWRGVITHTISIGVASLEMEDTDFDQLLIRADVALYKAKSSGKNTVCY